MGVYIVVDTYICISIYEIRIKNEYTNSTMQASFYVFVILCIQTSY